MTADARIPIPWKHRWRRFRYGAMPVFGFLGCLVLTLWLWGEQDRMPNMVAVVEQKSIPVAAGVDGILIAPSGESDRYWELFQQVTKGNSIARLDDSHVRATLRTLRVQLASLDKQLLAAEKQFELDAVEGDDERIRHHLNLEVKWSKKQIDVLDLTTEIASTDLLLQPIRARMEYNAPLVRKGIVSSLQQDLLIRRCDQLQQQIDDEMMALSQAEASCAEARQRLDDLPRTERTFEADVLLAQIRAQITTQQAGIEKLELQRKALEITAPFTGVISQIHCWPGQFVRRGDAVVTLAATDAQETEGRAAFAIAYVRREQDVLPHIGMGVLVRSRAPGSPRANGKVTQVWSQFEQIPTRQLRNPNQPEWGLPIRIELQDHLTPGFRVFPGELLDVTLDTQAGKPQLERGGTIEDGSNSAPSIARVNP